MADNSKKQHSGVGPRNWTPPKVQPKPWGDSYVSNYEMLKYMDETTLRLTPEQKELRALTREQFWGGMLSDGLGMQMLASIARNIQAKRVLDVGVFTGYSALTFAMALPEDGQVIAIDVDDEMPALGVPFWEKAGVREKIDLRIASAMDVLLELLANGEEGKWDAVFLDADKKNYDAYYEMSLKLLRKGGMIAIDNALWQGKVAHPEMQDDETKALDALNRKIGKDERVDASMMLVGDGTMLIFKR